MERILLDNQIINWRTLTRDRFQFLYEKSENGNITCPYCHEQLTFRFGIHKQPRFLHKKKKQHEACTNMELSILEQAATKEATEFEWKETKGILFKKPTFQPLEESEKSIASIENLSLSTSQYEATTYCDGPLLILAGAGSGKTRVLTSRAAYLLQQGINPNQMMLVTFTAKAAKEMKHRLSQLVSKQDASSIIIGTFHSIFYRILAHHNASIWNRNNLISFDNQKEKIIRILLKQNNINEQDISLEEIIKQISKWKNELLFPSDLTKLKDIDETTKDLYRGYEEYKNERHLFDFDDMLLGCYQLFKNEPAVLEVYQNRFTTFLIDEFQDSNKVQYEIMKMLTAKTSDVTVVGDDDQTIFSFRGSDPSIMKAFQKDFTNVKVIELERNYRSSHEIVTFAKAIISKNKERINKSAQASFEHGVPPFIFFPFDEEEEATLIVDQIEKEIEKGGTLSDIAILYRTNNQCRAIFERLSQKNIPMIVEPDMEFFYDRKLIRQMLAYLQLSIDPNNKEAIEKILPTQFIRHQAIKDVELYSLLEGCSLLDALPKVDHIAPFQRKKLEKIVPLFKELTHLGPFEAIEYVEKYMHFNDYVKKRGAIESEMVSDDIRDLKSIVKKFKTTASLLKYIDDMRTLFQETKSQSKQGQDGITFLTLHKSKGLEFSVVFILGVVDGSLPHDYALDSIKQGEHLALEEERRLFYVGITRAKTKLYMSVPGRLRGKKAQPSRFIRFFTKENPTRN